MSTRSRRKLVTLDGDMASSAANGPPTDKGSSSQPTPLRRTASAILPAPARNPFLPTSLEAALLSLYPLTLLLGSLFSRLSPAIRASESVYSAQHQSFQPPQLAPSYFARKRNVFNVYFVKIGWFWTTLALLVFVLTHRSFGSAATVPSRRRLGAAMRWALATAVWALTTQWFFGPPLIDRSFRLTGGTCQAVAETKAGLRPHESLGREILTHAQCKLAGGTWSGGIDISGHVFLLILGSALLWMEVLPTVLKAQGLREARQIVLSDGRVVSARKETAGGVGVSSAEAEKKQGTEDDEEVTNLGVKIAVAFVGLSWWMLLMTAAFFHTWTEKLSGLIVAFAGIWIVYFLPRGVPAARAVLGIPGV
jgi:hypothetical protein